MKNLLLILISAFFIASCLKSPTDNEYDDTEDLAFLEQNAQRDDVTVTESGLQYRIIQEGDGESPVDGSFVFVDYTATLVNGDPAFQSPDELDIIQLSDEVITGFVEGLQLMNEGAIYELVLPTELAFNDGRIIIIEVELDSFLRDQDQFLADNAALEDIEVTESGLQYRVIEQGEGSQPGPNDVVNVNYTGTYTNGYVFDSSPDGDPAEFNLAGVIEGFSEGIQLMNEGGSYELYIPSDIGYGNDPQNGIIPGAVLIFEVELVGTE